jgi:1-acyl-sn-glycerol-3-phosphate acyltransferase
VDRSTADVEAFRLAPGSSRTVTRCSSSRGTRSRDGPCGAGRDGVAVLALRTGAPIVPIAVAGSYDAGRAGSSCRIRAVTSQSRVRTPFRLADVTPRPDDRKSAEASRPAAIMHQIAALLPPAQQGRYGEPATVADTAPALTGAERDPVP